MTSIPSACSSDSQLSTIQTDFGCRHAIWNYSRQTICEKPDITKQFANDHSSVHTTTCLCMTRIGLSNWDYCPSFTFTDNMDTKYLLAVHAITTAIYVFFVFPINRLWHLGWAPLAILKRKKVTANHATPHTLASTYTFACTKCNKPIKPCTTAS